MPEAIGAWWQGPPEGVHPSHASQYRDQRDSSCAAHYLAQFVVHAESADGDLDDLELIVLQSDDIRLFEVVLRMCLVMIDVLRCAIFQMKTSSAEVSSGDARGHQSKHLPRLLAKKMPLGSK